LRSGCEEEGENLRDEGRLSALPPLEKGRVGEGIK
jgi:hypothetical protein